MIGRYTNYMIARYDTLASRVLYPLKQDKKHKMYTF